MSIIEFTGVRLYATDPSGPAGFGIDSPIVGSRHRATAVEFKGWVVGARHPVTSIEVRGAGPTRRLPLASTRLDVAVNFLYGAEAAASGFVGQLDLEEADDPFEATIVAVFADGARIPLARATGHRLATKRFVRPTPAVALDAAAPPSLIPPSGAGRPRASVVIPVHNQAALTRACLAALLANGNAAVPYEVVVVDDGSSDETAGLLTAFADRVQTITLGPNTGFGNACNAGASLARGEFIVFLNNDTEPLPGWLDALVADADANPEAAAVGSRLLFPDGTVQHAGVAIGADGYPHHLYAGFPADHPAVLRSRPMRLVTAACLLVRAPVFHALGGFDPAYRNGWEDGDFCLRLGEAGWGVRYCADSVVVHHESASRDPYGERELHNRGVWADRWHGRVEPDVFRYWGEDGLLVVDPIGPLYPQRIRLARELAVTELMTPTWATTTAADGRRRPAAAEPFPILGRVETPHSTPGVIGDPELPVAGWALSHAGIAGVETMVDGELRGEVVYGGLRPDVVAAHPEFVGHERCGFVGAVPLAGLADGDHRLEILIVANDGKEVRIGATFSVDAATIAAGRVKVFCDRPTAGERAVGVDGLLVAGWAVAPAGIARIEAAIDGRSVRPLPYGAPRPDIGQSHPSYPGAELSGFSGIVPLAELTPGEHRLTARAVATDGRTGEFEVGFVVASAGTRPRDGAGTDSEAAP